MKAVSMITLAVVCAVAPDAFAIDCEVSAWGPWSACSEPCDSTQWGGALGERSRTREVLVQPTTDGVQCPVLEQTEACNTQVCSPVDCELSLGAWSACSEMCGGGTQTRTVTVVTEPLYGGAACPAVPEVRACNTQACEPVDCELSIGPWGDCSEACGGGTQTRVVTVITEPLYGGAACPAVSEVQACNVQACPPVDCVVDFGAWSACSVTCGGGTQTRTGTITTQPENGGAACPTLDQMQACNTQDCPPVDCEMSAWSDWSECTAPCGGGAQTRTRTVTVEPANGGVECGALTEMQVCNDAECVCGDAIISDGETCEPSETPTCRDDCTFCGDGVVDDVEACDDENDVAGDGCTACVIDEPDMGVSADMGAAPDMGSIEPDAGAMPDTGTTDEGSDVGGAQGANATDDESCSLAGGSAGLPALLLFALGWLRRR